VNQPIALITGATSGLGGAVSARLAEAGWRLALVGRDGARLADVGPHDAVRIESDVSTSEGAKRAVAQNRSACPRHWSTAPAAR